LERLEQLGGVDLVELVLMGVRVAGSDARHGRHDANVMAVLMAAVATALNRFVSDVFVSALSESAVRQPAGSHLL
jgi:hypothetical protein